MCGGKKLIAATVEISSTTDCVKLCIFGEKGGSKSGWKTFHNFLGEV